MGDAERLDTEGIWEATAGLPEQVAQAAKDAAGIDGLPDRESIENVVVLGMGGSGIAGDILLSVAGPFLALPVVVVKSYAVPAFIGDNTLVFAVSFSGDTEETVEAASEAAAQGGKMVVISSGGELTKLGTTWGCPVIAVPGSIPQPRAAIGAMAIPALVVLEQMGLFPVATQWIKQAVQQLAKRRDALTGPKSEAAAVARRIGRTIPLVHGGMALGAAAAQRWKTQINENAKCPAFWAAQPELSHNEIAAWGQHGDLTRQAITLIALRHDHEHPQVSRRFDIAGDLMREVVADIEQIRARGQGELAQLLDLVMFGDFVSLEMAARETIDPGPVPVLAAMKTALKEG